MLVLRRWLPTRLLCAAPVIGVTVSLLLAWLPSIVLPWPPSQPSGILVYGQAGTSESPLYCMHEWSSPTFTRLQLTFTPDADADYPLGTRWSDYDPPQVPYWARRRTREVQRGSELIIDARGSPFRALIASAEVGPGASLSIRGGVSHPFVLALPAGPASRNDIALLPLQPILIGMFADVLFWSLVATIVGAVIVSLRRCARFERGCCPKCGYDRRGSYSDPCGECGAA